MGDGNQYYICLVFCWSWPKGWDVLQKGQQENGGLIVK